jgi:hypothetical protein
MGFMSNHYQSAIDYVNIHGTAVERARLRYLLYGEQAPDDVRQQFARGQRSDGGWSPPWAADYSSVDATCFQLAQADQMGLDRRSALFIDAVRFLAERQRADGYWEEEAEVADAAPPWAQPGDTAARLYLTANCGFWAAVTGLVPTAARDAAAYLSYHLREDGELPSFLQAHWLAAALWQQRGLVDEAAKTLGYLAARVGDLSAGNLAWLIIALREGGVPAADAAVSGALEQLLARRDPAGHWPSDEGIENSAHVTVEALKALQLCGRLA